MSMKKNKIAGAVYGFAVGDAMGATTEFMTENQIKATFGKVTDIIGGSWLHLEPGQVTDDTQMTMCVMDVTMRSDGRKRVLLKIASPILLNGMKAIRLMLVVNAPEVFKH